MPFSFLSIEALISGLNCFLPRSVSSFLVASDLLLSEFIGVKIEQLKTKKLFAIVSEILNVLLCVI